MLTGPNVFTVSVPVLSGMIKEHTETAKSGYMDSIVLLAQQKEILFLSGYSSAFYEHIFKWYKFKSL